MDEFTTLNIDNVVVQGRADDCAPGFMCAPFYDPNCVPCDTQNPPDGGICTTSCPTGVLHCGRSLPTNDNNATQACGGLPNLFDTSRCQQIEVCADPDATGNRIPTRILTADCNRPNSIRPPPSAPPTTRPGLPTGSRL